MRASRGSDLRSTDIRYETAEAMLEDIQAHYEESWEYTGDDEQFVLTMSNETHCELNGKYGFRSVIDRGIVPPGAFDQITIHNHKLFINRHRKLVEEYKKRVEIKERIKKRKKKKG